MSKRYSGKSFKDSSVKKKPKLSLKEKRKLKKDKQKNRFVLNFENNSSQLWVFLSFNILLNMYKSQNLWTIISETSQS